MLQNPCMLFKIKIKFLCKSWYPDLWSHVFPLLIFSLPQRFLNLGKSHSYKNSHFSFESSHFSRTITDSPLAASFWTLLPSLQDKIKSLFCNALCLSMEKKINKKMKNLKITKWNTLTVSGKLLHFVVSCTLTLVIPVNWFLNRCKKNRKLFTHF